MRSTIEIYLNGSWVRAAEFEPHARRPYTGTFGYDIEYAFSGNPPIAFGLPVTAQWQGLDASGEAPACPAILLDLVPQGKGRKYLEGVVTVGGSQEFNDLLLMQYGAFNPIGNLRLDTAVSFYRDQLKVSNPAPVEGFTLDGIIRREDDFVNHIWLHAMLSAGTTGVQGAAPKFLLTQDREGAWFADAALPDESALNHWMVKMARGKQEEDRLVLRNEASYGLVAKHCGLRIEHPAQMHGNLLFSRRFDREVDATGRLHRLHQESLASLAGLRNFGTPVSLFKLISVMRQHVTNPIQETVEFLCRDILNLAMRNTDNHARNTALQRLPDGTIRLTPLFDFTPMYLDPEFIVRGCKWIPVNENECNDWNDIVCRITDNEDEIKEITQRLKGFQSFVENLPAIMKNSGVDQRIIDDCAPSIAAQVARLDVLPAIDTARSGWGISRG